MIVRVVLLLGACAQLAVAVLFRWRTWRDRGAIVLIVTGAATLLLLSEAAGQVNRALNEWLASPALALLVPVLAFLLGLAGISPFLVALFLGFIHPDFALSLWITLPMVLGAVPQTLFRVWTMPPARG